MRRRKILSNSFLFDFFGMTAVHNDSRNYVDLQMLLLGHCGFPRRERNRSRLIFCRLSKQ
jgi:hypothetical protein